MTRTLRLHAHESGSVTKLVRIGLPCIQDDTYPIQFGSAIRTTAVWIEKAGSYGLDLFLPRVNTWIRSRMSTDGTLGVVFVC